MSLATNLSDLATRSATEAKALRTLLNGNAADLAALNTTAKANLVAAINEVLAASGGAADLDDLGDVVITTPSTGMVLTFDGTNWIDAVIPAASATVAGIVELATEAETTTGTDTVRAVTPAGVAAAVAALVAAAPGTLDTLNELAAALGDDPDFATTITTLIGTKQDQAVELTELAALTLVADRLPYADGTDSLALTVLTAAGRALLDDATVADQRTTLSVYSQAEIGDPEQDLVAVFEAGLV